MKAQLYRRLRRASVLWLASAVLANAAGCRFDNPAFRWDTRDDSSAPSTDIASTSVPSVQASTTQSHSEPAPSSTAPAETTSNSQTSQTSQSADSSNQTTNPEVLSQANCSDPKLACYTMQTSGLLLPNAQGFGIELRGLSPSCNAGIHCNLASAPNIMTLVYNSSNHSIRCFLPHAPNQVFEVQLPQSSEPFHCACWVDTQQAFLWVKGRSIDDIGYARALPASTGILSMGGARAQNQGDVTFYTGKLSFLRLWNSTAGLASMAEANQGG